MRRVIYGDGEGGWHKVVEADDEQVTLECIGRRSRRATHVLKGERHTVSRGSLRRSGYYYGPFEKCIWRLY